MGSLTLSQSLHLSLGQGKLYANPGYTEKSEDWQMLLSALCAVDS